MTIPSPDAPLPTGADKAAAVQTMFDTIAGRYDLVNRTMTFGLDVLWRKRTLRYLHLAPDARVADIAAGTGDFCRELTNAGATPIGFDLALGMLKHARTTAPLVQGDALNLPVANGAFDAATCGYALRNFVDLDQFFVELARIVRPGGRIGLLDVGQPRSALVARGYNFYFGRVVPKIGAVLSDRDAYAYLPRSVAYLPPVEEMKRSLADAGFIDVAHRELTGGLSQLLTATRANS